MNANTITTTISADDTIYIYDGPTGGGGTPWNLDGINFDPVGMTFEAITEWVLGEARSSGEYAAGSIVVVQVGDVQAEVLV